MPGNRGAILAPYDLRKVQGTTERYYISRELGKKYHIDLFALSNPEFNDIEFHPIRSTGRIPGLLWYNVVLLPILLYKIYRCRPDFLYIYKPLLLPPWIYSVITGTPIFIDLRTMPIEQQQELQSFQTDNGLVVNIYWTIYYYIYRALLPNMNEIFTLSQEIADGLADKYDAQRENITIIPLGVDLNKFSSTNGMDEIHGTRRTYKAVYIGSLTKVRRLDKCFEVLSENPELKDKIEIHLIGDGPDNDINYLRNEAEMLGVADNIIWHGFVEHDQLPKYLERMDIGLSPLPPHEAYAVSSPAKLFEYLAMELPVVCTDIPPHHKILKRDQTGFFYNYESNTEFGNAIREVIMELEENAESIFQNTRGAAENNSWKDRADEITEKITPYLE